MVDADTFELIDGVLPAEARDWYSSNGYLHVRRAVDPSMCSHLALAYGEVLNRSIEDDSGDIWYAPAAHGGRIIQRFNRLNVSSPTVANFFTEHPSMLAIAKGLLGDHAHFVTGEEGSEGAVMVTKDANNVGPHGALPWHCDGSFTRHLPINPFINAGVYLEDCNEDGGCLLVIPGSHLAFSP